jgi:hypothetical protein
MTSNKYNNYKNYKKDDMELPSDLPIPDHITDMKQAELHNIFKDLDQKIITLSRNIETHRKYGHTKDGKETIVETSSRCQWICKPQQHPQIRLQCLEQCTNPIVHFEKIDAVDKHFPIDAQRLRTDLALRNTFERHQRAPQTIKPTLAEAIDISDIYAMPIATVALPEEAWDRAMEVMKNDKFKEQRMVLVTNWHDRSRDYNNEAKEELSRKIHRHDSENILWEAISETSNE